MPSPNPTGSHGTRRPGATSAAAHSRNFAAIGPATPGNGRSHGPAVPAIPGHVPTLLRALRCPAITLPAGGRLSRIQRKIEIAALLLFSPRLRGCGFHQGPYESRLQRQINSAEIDSSLGLGATII